MATVQKPGDVAYAIRDGGRNKPPEILTFAFVPTARKAQWTLTNALRKVQRKPVAGHFLGAFWSHFASFVLTQPAGRSEWLNHFSGVDQFNRRLNDKGWPHKCGGRLDRAEQRAASNYVFTVLLVNLHHLWKSLSGDRSDLSFSEFCDMLALELMGVYAPIIPDEDSDVVRD
jgi:hypothetical protein